MPRVTELAEAEVFAAIRSLLEEGEYPTSARLRERLEHRGSPVVLQRFLASWYERFGPEMARKAEQAPKKAKRVGLQEELRRLTEEAMAEFEHAKAQRVAELDARARELETLQELLSTREDVLLDRERDLDNREISQAELVRGIQSASRAAEQKKDEALASLAAAELKVAVHEARITELEREAGKAEALRGELSEAREELAKARALITEVTRARDEAVLRSNEESISRAKLAGALDAREEADQQRQVELVEARSALAAAETRIATLASQLEATKEAVEGAKSVGRAAAQERDVAEASLKQLRQEMESAKGRLACLQEVEKALNQMDSRLATRLEALLEKQGQELIERISPMLRKEKTKGG